MALKGHALHLATFAGSVVVAIAPLAQARPVSLDLREAAMPRALADLARTAGVELLFDQKLVLDLKAPAVRGRMSADAALEKLLAGTGVGYRLTGDGAFVLFALSAARVSDPSDGAVSELLVVGRRTQNVDIRRTANDVQPYKIATRDDLEAAHRGDVEQFLRAREPANAQRSSSSQDLTSNRSAIDLRGFGPRSTLVLVDGRRMPYVPSGEGEFVQADVNGIPPGAIERIETLTSTAGGIYGPGATGGVVNIVLRREYRGADLITTSGLTDRGDAGQARIDARLGFTPDDGATDVMLYASHSITNPLYQDERDYTRRSEAIEFAANPLDLITDSWDRNGVIVFSRLAPLTLEPALGGTPLNSHFTFLPMNFSGTEAERAAVLVTNSGKIPPPAPRNLVAPTSLLLGAKISSGLVNVRRKLGPHFEVYVDGLHLENQGRVSYVSHFDPQPTGADAPGNPFGQSVEFRYPTPPSRARATRTITTSRFSGGFIADLPASWRAAGDYTQGQTRFFQKVVNNTMGVAFRSAQGTGFSGGAGRPLINPLGDSSALLDAVVSYQDLETIDFSLVDKSKAASLRLAGPVMALPGGALTATLLVETRHDRVPTATFATRTSGFDLRFELPEHAQDVISAYGEVRAPIGPSDAKFLVLRELEVQLAIRHDRITTTLPQDSLVAETGVVAEAVSIGHDATVYTIGARSFPVPELMLRASFATGALPPTLSDLQAATFAFTNPLHGASDPRRGGTLIGSEGAWSLLTGGSNALQSAQTQSLNLGGVMNPHGKRGPRVSLDYSRITQTGEAAPLGLSPAQLVTAESDYPGRVVRAPLTAADIAAGYTGGRIMLIDTGAINVGRSVVEAVDLQLDWRLPTDRRGEFRLYGSATWQPTFRQRGRKDQAAIDRVGYFDGPLEWRGNAGVEWVWGPLSLDLNAQYYDSYSVLNADPAYTGNAARDAYDTRIPSQIYIDFAARRRFTFRDAAARIQVLDVRFGVQNLLDKRPPTIVLPDTQGYSHYGDARRRRIELAVSSKF